MEESLSVVIYTIKIPRSRKKRIWKKWGISKGFYTASYYAKEGVDGKWGRPTRTVKLLDCIKKGETRARIIVEGIKMDEPEPFELGETFQIGTPLWHTIPVVWGRCLSDEEIEQATDKE